MTTIVDTQHDVQKWVEYSLTEKNLKNISVEISKGLNGDGFAGDIIFAKVSAERNGKNEVYNLVLKFGKNNDLLRESMPIKEAYEQEIYMYDIVFPAYNSFLRKRNQGEIDFVPKCYKTVNEGKVELLVLENLKPLGYQLHDKTTSMNVEHIEEVLKVYGRWHAISFAMQDQRKDEYDKLGAPLIDAMASFMKTEDLKTSLVSAREKFTQGLIDINEHELLRKFNKIVKKDLVEMFEDLFRSIPDKTVIAHGDCWNNNFMFKYGENKTRPERVAMLDWQIANRKSPVFDLSYFIYAVSSKRELDQIDRLLNMYYGSLSESIKKLGSDPQKLFTFAEFMDHWRKYSIYGLLMGVMVFPFSLCEREDAPNLGEFNAENNFATAMQNLEIKNKTEYNRRVYGIVSHYMNYHNIL